MAHQTPSPSSSKFAWVGAFPSAPNTTLCTFDHPINRSADAPKCDDGTCCSEHVQGQLPHAVGHPEDDAILACVRLGGANRHQVSSLLTNICSEKEYSDDDCHHVIGSDVDKLHHGDMLSLDAAGLDHLVMQTFVWVFAIAAIIGNVAVFCQCVAVTRQMWRKMHGPEKVHRWLVCNLAVSDFLMGVYLTMYGIEHTHFGTHVHGNSSTNRYLWQSSPMCNLMGVLSFSSSQISVTLLAIITSFRLHSTLQPFQSQAKQFQRSVIASTLCWLFWIVYAIVPTLDTEWVKLTFNNFVLFDSAFCRHQGKEMHYSFFSNLVRRIDEFTRANCSSRLPAVASDNSHGQATWSSLVERGKALGVVPRAAVPRYFGYYNERSVCAGNYFSVYSSRSMPYTLLVIVYNIVAFIYILIAYIHIFRSNRTPMRATRLRRDPSIVALKLNQHRSSSVDNRLMTATTIDVRERENRRMQLRIGMVILTDFVCWVPLCLLAICFTARSASFVRHGCQFHEYVNWWQTVYSNVTIIVIPINSALNPFIYSARFWSGTGRNVCDLWRQRGCTRGFREVSIIAESSSPEQG